MKTRRPDDLDELLARGGLSGPARERTLEAVLEVARGERSRFWRRLFYFATPAVATVAVGVMLLVRPAAPGFTPKGNPGAPLLEVACKQSAGPRCPRGGTLLFRVAGATAGGFLSAYAEPASGPGERVWYLPAGGEAAAVQATEAPQLLRLGARLGPEQPPGAYKVHLVLSKTPLDRAGALAPEGALATATWDLEVTP